MDNSASIRSVVRQFVRRDVANDESLFESGLLDSFSLPDMVAAIEQAVGVKIPDSDLNPQIFDSIERIETYIRSRV